MLNAQSSDLGKPLKNVVKNLPADAGSPRDTGPGLGRSSREEDDNSLQYSHLENPMDRGAWQTTVHGVTDRTGRLSTPTGKGGKNCAKRSNN